MCNFKKMLSLVISFIMILSLGTNLFNASVFAANDSSVEKAVFDLTSLGIIEGDKDGDMGLLRPLIRAEVAAIIVRLLDLESMISSIENISYIDVSEDKWYTPYIKTVSNLSIMTGDGNGYFRPEDSLSYHEAVKVLVSSLGYSYPADQSGGFYEGYVKVANDIRLLKNVSADKEIKRQSFFVMLYNSLDIDIMLKTVNDKDEYYIDKGNTFRISLMNRMNETLFEGKGIVTASRVSVKEPI